LLTQGKGGGVLKLEFHHHVTLPSPHIYGNHVFCISLTIPGIFPPKSENSHKTQHFAEFLGALKRTQSQPEKKKKQGWLLIIATHGMIPLPTSPSRPRQSSLRQGGLFQGCDRITLVSDSRTQG